MNPIIFAGLTASLCLGLPAKPAPGGAATPGRKPVPVPAAREPDIGWCCFYPSTDVAMGRLPDSGATILSVCAGGWGMEQIEGKPDFAAFDQQLAYARRYGLKLALIDEINPVYTPAWLRAKAKAAGQSVRSAAGVDGDIPSTSSSVFREAQEAFVRRFVAHVRETDTTGAVAYYHPGAEWWFPMNERYNPADIARFRGWLRRRYGAIARLNAAWNAHFADFEQVPAPELEMSVGVKGRPGMGAVTSLDSGAQHGSWSTPAATDPNAAPGADTFAAIEPGRRYTVSAWVKTERLRGQGAFLEIAWVRPTGGAPLAIDDGAPVRGTRGWTRLTATFQAPKEAGRAWILLKTMGTGETRWDDVDLHAEGATANLAPNPGLESGGAEPAAWRFQNWSGGRQVQTRWERRGGRNGGACLAVSIPEATPGARSYGNLDAAVYDWSTFWYEAGADYIDSMAELVHRYDPTRPAVTYLTFSFAYPAEWDYSQMYAIAPDEVAMRGRHIDAFGLQTCAADGDPFRVNACLDLVRKYDKPVWTVDLVDFTSGVQIGFPAMNRATQSAIQHGAKGIIYCAWHIPTVLDYSFHPRMAPAHIRRMVTEARASVKLLDGLTVRPDGAILEPILPASPNDPDGYKNDYRSFLGWYKLLESLHQTVDIVTFGEIEKRAGCLDRYPYLVVPDCAYLPEAVRARLSRYVQRGGRLITGGRFAQRTEAALPLPPRPIRRTVLPDYGARYAGDPIRDTHAGNTPPLFLWRPETPATRRALRDGVAALRAALTRSPTPMPMAGKGASGVSCIEYRGQGRRALYLVNRTDAPVVPRSIRLRIGKRRSGVVVYADTKRVTGKVDAAGDLVLPAFQTSCVVKTTNTAK